MENIVYTVTAILVLVVALLVVGIYIKRYFHKDFEYKGKPYSILFLSKRKDPKTREWIKVVIYKAKYDNPDGVIWVRDKDEFYEKFQRTNCRS